MSENTVYTLAKTLQKTDGLEKDFFQMLAALQDTIEKESIKDTFRRQSRKGLRRGTSPQRGDAAPGHVRFYG